MTFFLLACMSVYESWTDSYNPFCIKGLQLKSKTMTVGQDSKYGWK